jgi:hypothetical protein
LVSSGISEQEVLAVLDVMPELEVLVPEAVLSAPPPQATKGSAPTPASQSSAWRRCSKVSRS